MIVIETAGTVFRALWFHLRCCLLILVCRQCRWSVIVGMAGLSPSPSPTSQFFKEHLMLIILCEIILLIN